MPLPRRPRKLTDAPIRHAQQMLQLILQLSLIIFDKLLNKRWATCGRRTLYEIANIYDSAEKMPRHL